MLIHKYLIILKLVQYFKQIKIELKICSLLKVRNTINSAINYFNCKFKLIFTTRSFFKSKFL